MFQIVRSVVKVCFVMKHVPNIASLPVIVTTSRAMVAIPGFITTRAIMSVDSVLPSPVTKQRGSAMLVVLTGTGEICVLMIACIPTADHVPETMGSVRFAFQGNMDKTALQIVAAHAHLPVTVMFTVTRRPGRAVKDSVAQDGLVPIAPLSVPIIAHPLKMETLTAISKMGLAAMVACLAGTQIYAIYYVIRIALADFVPEPDIA